jgi:hypothetical protein
MFDKVLSIDKIFPTDLKNNYFKSAYRKNRYMGIIPAMQSVSSLILGRCAPSPMREQEEKTPNNQRRSKRGWGMKE